MLFETVLIVLMSGLITHVGSEAVGGPDVKKYAAMVVDRHGHHKPRLLIQDRYTDNDGDIDYELKPDDKIEFLGGMPGGATAVEDFCDDMCTDCEVCDGSLKLKFRQFVPSLTEPLTQSLLHNAVKQGQPHENVAARLFYPKGALFIAFYHDKEAKFLRSSDLVRTQCVPKVTGFYGKAPGPVVLRITHANETYDQYPLEDFSIISIINQPDLSETPDNNEATAHFRNYGGLLKPRYLVVPRRIASVEYGNDCPEEPKLPTNTTVGQMLNIFVTQNAATFTTAFAVPQAAHGATAKMSVDARSGFDILISEHPACTNTDWP